MAGVNKITRSVAPKTLLCDADKYVSAAVSYNQGDLLIFDVGTGLIDNPAAEVDGAKFVGVALQDVVAGKVRSPYTGTDVDAAQGLPALAGPQFGVVVKCISKTGDSWVVGQAAFLDPATGTRGVSSAGTKAIGIFQGKAVAAAAAGQEVEVLLGARYPTDTLIF